MVSKWIQNLDNGEAIRNVNIKEAVEMIADAWRNVKPMTIKNCWQLTKILPAVADEMEIDEIDEDMANLISALNRLKIADSSVSMTAEEYAQLDGSLTSAELPTEEEILEEFLVGRCATGNVSAYGRRFKRGGRRNYFYKSGKTST